MLPKRRMLNFKDGTQQVRIVKERLRDKSSILRSRGPLNEEKHCLTHREQLSTNLKLRIRFQIRLRGDRRDEALQRLPQGGHVR